MTTPAAVERLAEALCAAHMASHGGDCDTPAAWRALAEYELQHIGAVIPPPDLVAALRKAHAAMDTYAWCGPEESERRKEALAVARAQVADYVMKAVTDD